MLLEDAMAWLRGERSMQNVITGDGSGSNGAWVAWTAKADASITEQAYWIVRAHAEGLVKPAESGGKDGE
jgi:hypothetical protein